jgi:3-methyladenine DNA glycosylase AlkD
MRAAAKPPTLQSIMKELKSLSHPENLAGMARYGIKIDNALGVKVPDLRRIARRVKRNHGLALELWGTGVHDARILASMLAEPEKATPALMDEWAELFYAWDICDQTCMNFFVYTKFAHKKAVEWSKRREEFIKRAGFALMACIAWKNKDMKESECADFFACMERESADGRNYVKKSVNWALRQAGKRNPELHCAAIACAERIAKQDSKSAKWIAADALRELKNPKVIARIKN